MQQYTKSSYFQECNSAIANGGYAYLFGDGLDKHVDSEDFTDLITTQICYDVGYARKKEKPEQKDHPALIHVIQSNTKEISEKFVYKFWELFPRGIDKLVFDGCVTTEDWKFSSLMDGEYEVKKFSVVNSNITLEDIDSILCLVYIYAIESFDFSGNNLNITDFNKCFNNRLGSFVRTVTYSL